jgi:hypothetical protein
VVHSNAEAVEVAEAVVSMVGYHDSACCRHQMLRQAQLRCQHNSDARDGHYANGSPHYRERGKNSTKVISPMNKETEGVTHMTTPGREAPSRRPDALPTCHRRHPFKIIVMTMSRSFPEVAAALAERATRQTAFFASGRFRNCESSTGRTRRKSVPMLRQNSLKNE